MRSADSLVRGCLVAIATGVAIAPMVAAPSAQGAYPGVPGPIAYSKITLGNPGEGEPGFAGGLFAHGPHIREAPRQLTDNPADASPEYSGGRGAGSPSYSPNGHLIAFSRSSLPFEEALPVGTNIYLSNADGSDVRQLTSGDFVDSNPSFSPNGRLVVFDRRPAFGGEQATHIFSISTDGSGLRQITNDAGSDSDPVFTPNGRRIVFVSNRRRSGRRDRSNILSMRPDGSHMRLLIGGPRAEFDPDVSPNGHQVAFASTRDRGPNIFVAWINGRHVRELTHGGRNLPGQCRLDCFEGPSWAPDGRHIAFLRVGHAESAIGVIRAVGGRYKVFDSGHYEIEEGGPSVSVGAPAWGPRRR